MNNLCIENIVNFSKGLIGINKADMFCIKNYNTKKKISSFKKFVSLNGNYSFITLQIDIKNKFLDYDDITNTCRKLDIDLKNTKIFIIATVVTKNDTDMLSLNFKAPIFVNTKNKEAVQYVMKSEKYDKQHVLEEDFII